METRAWIFGDKREFPDGPWTNEPDKMQWEDEVTGYPCLIVRNGMGALCGYVGVGPEHPAYQVLYTELDLDMDIHGGLTFSAHCTEGDPEHGICHVTDNPDPRWWLGFDCAHSSDLVPGLLRFSGREAGRVYRNVNYVKFHCCGLAIFLKEMEEAG